MGCNLFSRRRGRGRGSRKFFKPIRSLRGKRYLKSTAKSRQFGGNHCTTHYTGTKGGGNMLTDLGNSMSSGLGRLWGNTKKLAGKTVDKTEKLGKDAGHALGKGMGAVETSASNLGRSVEHRLGGGSRRGRRRRRKSRRRRRKGCGCK